MKVMKVMRLCWTIYLSTYSKMSCLSVNRDAMTHKERIALVTGPKPNKPVTRDNKIHGNCSTWVKEGTRGRKRLLDRLNSGQALPFSGIHNRAHGCKQVTSPVGAKTVRDLPKDRAHANSLLTGGTSSTWITSAVSARRRAISTPSRQ
jgi:hypothetical protein